MASPGAALESAQRLAAQNWIRLWFLQSNPIPQRHLFKMQHRLRWEEASVFTGHTTVTRLITNQWCDRHTISFFVKKSVPKKKRNDARKTKFSFSSPPLCFRFTRNDKRPDRIILHSIDRKTLFSSSFFLSLSLSLLIFFSLHFFSTTTDRETRDDGRRGPGSVVSGQSHWKKERTDP